ncbi:uncharacterized protein J3D65DRAFT_625547 [Phyllosticta citribraziliensis]|uniref:Uncharacterized protein n=1 Tax=Phyllosticta citribraziliensis TaxID=989973 RepID=A0ABR1LUH7_9PEZI
MGGWTDGCFSSSLAATRSSTGTVQAPWARVVSSPEVQSCCGFNQGDRLHTSNHDHDTTRHDTSSPTARLLPSRPLLRPAASCCRHSNFGPAAATLHLSISPPPCCSCGCAPCPGIHLRSQATCRRLSLTPSQPYTRDSSRKFKETALFSRRPSQNYELRVLAFFSSSYDTIHRVRPNQCRVTKGLPAAFQQRSGVGVKPQLPGPPVPVCTPDWHSNTTGEPSPNVFGPMREKKTSSPSITRLTRLLSISRRRQSRTSHLNVRPISARPHTSSHRGLERS